MIYLIISIYFLIGLIVGSVITIKEDDPDFGMGCLFLWPIMLVVFFPIYFFEWINKIYKRRKYKND